MSRRGAGHLEKLEKAREGTLLPEALGGAQLDHTLIRPSKFISCF